MRRAIQLAGLLVGAVVVTGTMQASVEGAATAPQPPLSAPAEPAVAAPGYLIIPEDPGPLGPQEELEARLAALARAVEARATGPDPMTSFDVEALADDIGGQLERVETVAQVSVHVRDLESQLVLFDYFGHAALNPASNQKLLTSSAALDLLGSDHVFETRIARSDDTLYLVGAGDPTLHVEDLQALATIVAQQVEPTSLQHLVVDDSVFSSARFGPGYSLEGPGFSYEAPSGALSLNFNTVEVTVYPERGARSLAVAVEPMGSHIVIENTAKVGRRRSLSVTSRADGDKTVVAVSGTLTRRSRPVVVRRRVTDPGLFTGSAFARILAELTASEPLPVARGTVPAGADTVVVNDSKPLIEVLDSGLAYSNNFMAEQVLRTLAWEMTGDPGDWESGQSILEQYWSTLVGDAEHVVVVNASGLSRQGRLTTAGLVDLISMAHRTAQPGESLIDALPVSGEAGTMRSRLRWSGKRVRAKTGTLHGVSGLTGVITREDGTPQVGFSILINTDKPHLFAKRRRRIEDNIVMAVLRGLDDYETRRGRIGAG